MEYLYRLSLKEEFLELDAWTTKEEMIIRNHFKHLLSLKEEGLLLVAGKSKGNDKDTIGLVIFKAPSEETALDIMNSDPAVKEGLMTGFLQEYSSAVINTSYKKD